MRDYDKVNLLVAFNSFEFKFLFLLARLPYKVREPSFPCYLCITGGRIVGFIQLYIDLRPGQTCHSKDAEVAYSIGVGELG